jgi:hypothetical protein
MYSVDDISMMNVRIKTKVISRIGFDAALLVYFFSLPLCLVPISSLNMSWKGWAESVNRPFSEAPGRAKLSRMAQTTPKFIGS